MAIKKATKKSVKKTVVKKTAKKRSPKVKKTYIAFVLDKSASMGTVRDETILTFYNQVEKIKKESKDIKTSICLFTFNHAVDKVFFNAPVSKLQELNAVTYLPDGSTAMFDAVGDMIDALEKQKDIGKKDTAVLVLVISDGEENSSRRFRQNDIAEKIQKLQATGRWTFSYLGANQDLSRIAANLNIPINNTRAFSATGAGMCVASASTNSALGGYYDSLHRGVTSSKSFYTTDTKDKDDDDLVKPAIISPGSLK